MKTLRLLLFISIISPFAYGGTKGAGTSFPAQYEGGSVPLKQNHSVKAVVAGDVVVFVQHGRRISVPVESISQISCATGVRRRFGAPVLGLVPRVDLDKVETHYVGLTWTDRTQAGASQEVLFKLSAGEYRDFIGMLERLTGKQAVDTKKIPTVVRYDL